MYNWPNSPATNDTVTLSGVTYKYDGVKWIKVTSTASTLATVTAVGSTTSTPITITNTTESSSTSTGALIVSGGIASAKNVQVGGDLRINKAYTETVYAITDGAAFTIDPNNGTIQTITLGASRTPVVANFGAGQSMTLMVDDGASAYTITWTTIGVTWVGGSAPTLAASGYTIINLWKVGSTIYGQSPGAA